MHCEWAPRRVSLYNPSTISLVTVKGWDDSANKPVLQVRSWNPLGAQWLPNHKNFTILQQAHGVLFFPGTKHEVQVWLPAGMPPGRYIHRRENTGRDAWQEQPPNGYYGKDGHRDEPDAKLYHRWKPVIATTHVFAAQASAHNLFNFS